MSVASQNVIPEDWKASIIRVFDYTDKNLQGTLYNPYYGGEVVFRNLIQLLLLMEQMMDELNCPQAAAQSQQFGDVSRKTETACPQSSWLHQPNQEALATFYVKVLFRQGASWQGKLVWKEEKTEISFRSALEMIQLMDSALSQPETEKESQDEMSQHIG